MKKFVIFGGVCAFAAVLLAVYFFGKKEESADDGKIVQQYVNSDYKFAIEFPKTSSTYLASCKTFETGKNGAMPITAVLDEANRAVYIANSATVEVSNIQEPSGDFSYDFKNCKEVPTTLELIKKGYANGLPEKMGSRSYPLAIKFQFGRASNDQGLIAIGEKALGVSDCQVASKKFVEGSSDTYEIKLRGQGEAGEAGGKCFLDADYQFLYSPTTKTAVVSSGYQNCVLGGDQGCVPTVKLLD